MFAIRLERYGRVEYATTESESMARIIADAIAREMKNGTIAVSSGMRECVAYHVYNGQRKMITA